MKFLKSFFSKDDGNSRSNIESLSASLMFGDMPKDTIFEKLSHLIDADLREKKLNYIHNFEFKYEKKTDPDYAGLVSLFCFTLSFHVIDNFLSRLSKEMYNLQFKDDKRLERLSIQSVFLLIGALKLATQIDANLIDDYIQSIKIGIIKNYFIIKLDENSNTAIEIAKKSEIYFNALINDKRENTQEFINDIANFFVASTQLDFSNENDEKFVKVISYGKRLYVNFENALLVSKL